MRHVPLTVSALFLVAVLLQPWMKADEPSSSSIPAVRFDPVKREIEGFTVHVDPALLPGGAATEIGEPALRMLGDHLNRIALLMPSDRLETLRKMEIWIEHDHPRLKSMQYHPGVGWLKRNNHDPRLVKKVHIPVAKALISRQQLLKHPAVVLHELSHAYHDQILGFDYEPVREAYEKARESGSYDKVLLYTGKKVKHYAMTNHKEYFAEATEAYFYRNDFYPFVRAELKEHDPVLHEIMKNVWGSVE